MKTTVFVLLVLTTNTCFSQTKQKLVTFASLQYNHTLYDEQFFHKTGIGGMGVQLFSKGTNRLRPTLEMNADLFTEHGIGPADAPTKRTFVIPSVYLGPSFHPTHQFFIAATIGSTFYNQAHLGVRPSIGFYP